MCRMAAHSLPLGGSSQEPKKSHKNILVALLQFIARQAVSGKFQKHEI